LKSKIYEVEDWKKARFYTHVYFHSDLAWLILPSSSSDALSPRS
jgi:hypothetical protein